MIVVSASLKKSGSGWYFNLTNDLLVAAGHTDVRALREAYGLEAVLQEDNCRINPNALNLARVLRPHRQGHTFAVKTHAAPTPSLRLLLRLGLARATYIYRDPRDVVLSALDHGERLRLAGKPNVLAELESVDDAARYVRRLLDDWEAWTALPGTLVTRYEDLVADDLAEIRRLAAFLDLDVPDDAMRDIAARYRPERRLVEAGQRLHFNKGIVGRFRSRMNPHELALCTEHFGPYLRRMGYAA